MYRGQQCLLTWHTPARHALTYQYQAGELSGEAVHCPAAAPCWEGSAAEQCYQGLWDALNMSSIMQGIPVTTAGSASMKSISEHGGELLDSESWAQRVTPHRTCIPC